LKNESRYVATLETKTQVSRTTTVIHSGAERRPTGDRNEMSTEEDATRQVGSLAAKLLLVRIIWAQLAGEGCIRCIT